MKVAVLGAAGLIAGGVSLLAGVVGDVMDEDKEKKQVKTDVNERNQNSQQETQKGIPFKSLSQQGQVATSILH